MDMNLQKQADWSSCKNILCIRIDNLGDVIMTTPAIRALKESVPGRKITLLTSGVGNAIARLIPEIDDVIIFDTPWVKNAESGSREAVYEIVEKLKERAFDAAVIFTVYSQNPLPTAMLCYLAGIPKVAGYCRENPYQLLTDWLPDNEPLYEIKHEVIRQLDLVKSLGAKVNDDTFSLSIPAGAVEQLKGKLVSLGVDVHKPWLVIHPGVSEQKRQYPVELFAEAARNIAEELGYQILLTGVASEKGLTDYIAQETGDKAFSLAGVFSIEELCALLKISPLLISNNTGPVHIVAAVQTPVIVLYALTNPQHTPWKVKHKVLPFDVPKELRSKNTIITYAYEQSFTSPPQMVQPAEILKAIRDLLFVQQEVEVTALLKL
jgi:lipopolysaccharide heptosyltransferase II